MRMSGFAQAREVKGIGFCGDWNSFYTICVEPDFQKQIEKGSGKNEENAYA